MTVSFVAAAQAGDGQTAQVTSLALTIPATLAPGDTALILLDLNVTPTLASIPTGWTVLDGPTVGSGSNVTTYLLGKELVSGDPGSTVTLTFTASAKAVASLHGYRGGDFAALAFAAVAESSVSTFVLPTLAGVPAGSAVVAGFLRRKGTAPAGTITFPAGYTVPTNGRASTVYTTGAQLYMATGYRITTVTGSVGGESATSDQAGVGENYLIAIPPAATAKAAGLSGSGSLSAFPSKVTAAQPAGLSGSGSLSTTQRLGFARSAALSGAGALSGGVAVSYTRAAALSGNGLLEGTPVPGGVRAAALGGDGELQADALGFSEANLVSDGTMVAFPYLPSVFIAGLLSGSGSLLTSQRAGVVRAAALAAAGQLTALGLITPRAADLAGTGYLSTWQQQALRLGLVVPITFRLGGNMPQRMYLGDLLVWRP